MQVKLWQIPKDGLITPLTEWWVDLHGHSRRVGYLEWHPTAENIILSAGYDYKVTSIFHSLLLSGHHHFGFSCWFLCDGVDHHFSFCAWV